MHWPAVAWPRTRQTGPRRLRSWPGAVATPPAGPRDRRSPGCRRSSPGRWPHAPRRTRPGSAATAPAGRIPSRDAYRQGAPRGRPDRASLDHVTSPPVPAGPADGWYPPAPGGRGRRRRTGRRRVALAFITVAVVLAGWWLLTQQPRLLGVTATGQPPASRHASWLSGTWTWAAPATCRVTHWEADLTFARSGRTGTFRFPTLGCSGKLVMIRISGRAAFPPVRT